MAKEPKVIYSKKRDIYIIKYPHSQVEVDYCSSMDQYFVLGGTPDGNGKLTLPASFTYKGETHPITFIERDAFLFNENLKSIIIPDGYKIIGQTAFRGTNLKTLILPPSITNLGAEMCSICDKLKSVWIQNSEAYYNPYDKSSWTDHTYVEPSQEEYIFHYDDVIEELNDYVAFPVQTKIYLGPDKTPSTNNLTDIETREVLY